KHEGVFHVISSLCDFIGRWFCFQAEDGIRDLTVTGVQTCALPILFIPIAVVAVFLFQMTQAQVHRIPALLMAMGLYPVLAMISRSEERRVGKECTSRSTPTS